jgi:phosphoglycerate dehydrogenase-like enzyme
MVANGKWYSKMKVSVTSPSFSKNTNLQNELFKYFPNAKLNIDGIRFTSKELVNFINNSEAVIIGLEDMNSDVLKLLPNLKIISKYGVGLNNIDLDYCTNNNIEIGWSGGVNKLSVAEVTVGYMLMLMRNIYVTSNQLKQGIWNKSGGCELSNKVIGIIGIGNIGKEVIRLLQPFNCKILVNDIIKQDDYYKKYNLIESTKEEIFRKSDIISIHTPLDNTTINMIDKKVFDIMNSKTFIINSARGGIINEDDLKFALMHNLIAGAAIDAYMEEPPTDSDLLSLPNLICTPHICGNSIEAIESMGLSAINHIRRYFKI